MYQGARAAFFSFYESAEGGSADAQATIALMFLVGWVNREEKVDLAEYWARKSAEQDNAYGMWVLAWALIEKGEFSGGFERLLLSAERSFAPALFSLSTLLFNGAIAPRDRLLGLRLASTAARLGHHSAKVFIAESYRRGEAGSYKVVYGNLLAFYYQHVKRWIYLLMPGKFGSDQLIYARQMIIENEFRRKFRGDLIDPKYEKRLSDLISGVSSN